MCYIKLFNNIILIMRILQYFTELYIWKPIFSLYKSNSAQWCSKTITDLVDIKSLL